jgi:hypothetical protein
MSDILQEVVSKMEDNLLKEEDLEQFIPQFLDFYGKKINFLARKAYNFSLHEEMPKTVSLAFQEQARSEITNAAYTYLFKYEHWRTNRNFNSYLVTCLNRLATRINNDLTSVKKVNVLICPYCQQNNNKEILINEGNLWRCLICSKRADQILVDLKKSSGLDKINLEAKLNSHKLFALHSKKGFRCPDCLGFIPKSSNTANGISCSFDLCGFVGKIDHLEEMIHPSSSIKNQDISIFNSSKDSGGLKDTDLFLNKLHDNSIDPDSKIDISQTINNEYNILIQVINDQISSLERNGGSGTFIQKTLMYEAFKKMVNLFPEEMISYLVHQKQHNDFPLQARIFQEYTNLIENFLPFEIKKDGQYVEIVDLTDPYLGLFLGKSVFKGLVKNNYKVYNETQERYIGGKLFKDYGPCFIGKLLNIVNSKTEESYLKDVKSYNFAEISLSNVEPGTEVIVSHFRIPSHYEMGALVFLQRIRRHLVDKIFLRLNQKKRIPKVNKK